MSLLSNDDLSTPSPSQAPSPVIHSAGVERIRTVRRRTHMMARPAVSVDKVAALQSIFSTHVHLPILLLYEVFPYHTRHTKIHDAYDE